MKGWAFATCLIVCGIVMPLSWGQGTRSDYERARTLRQTLEGKVQKAHVTPHWDAQGTRFWYRNDLADGEREFIRVDALHAAREPAFDHARLAKALAKATGKKVSSTHLPIDQLDLADDASFQVLVAGAWWRCDRKTYRLEKTTAPQQSPALPQRRRRRRAAPSASSPDGKWTAFVKDNHLSLRSGEDGSEHTLMRDGKPDYVWTGEFFWSPDSRRLLALRRKETEPRKVYLIESSPGDQLQPRLHSFPYPKPGDPLPTPTPHLFDVENKKEVPVSTELFSNPWEVSEVRWEKDSKRFTFLYNQRGHQVLRVIAVDANSGKATAIVDEQSKTFIDYAGKHFSYYLEESPELIWMSERSGWNHLYLVDRNSGKVKNPITHGEWVVRGVDRVDPVKRQVWFHAGGIHPGQDPYFVHYARVNFDGTGLALLTEGDGTHHLDFSPDRRYFLDTWSRVDLPPITELLRSEDGKRVCLLERADMTALHRTGWKPPERFVARGRDGKTAIHGVIFWPRTVDRGKKYPIIENIYAGPQSSYVPKAFHPYHGQQELAELGFVVVQMDGMGTSNRSKAFHDVCWKNLGDAGFPDRIRWIRAAADKYPCLDLGRVGIYGGSAGGQNALRALEAHGDFYKVAVADCGCHDNRMDKVWWNELWMGWPVGPHYAEQSNVTNARHLQSKLLLVVGEMDRNVDPASTMQVVNALVKADKDFDLLVIPGAGHGAAESPYGRRRRQDFFVRHLLGVEPRSRP